MRDPLRTTAPPGHGAFLFSLTPASSGALLRALFYNCCMKPRVIVFAKDPQPGKVKTRMAKAMGQHEAARLYQAMLLDLHSMLMRMTQQVDIEFHWDVHSNFFEGIPLLNRLQQGNDLGAKLLFALEEGLRDGAPAVLVLGSDVPTLTPDAVQDLLSRPEDVAFGPSPDGGFWGVLARKTNPAMFAGVRWSSGDALRDCIFAAEHCGLALGFGQVLADADEERDLLALDAQSLGKHLRKALDELVQPPPG